MLATVLAGVLALSNGICTTGSTRTCKLSGCANAQQVCLPDRTWDFCRCGCDDGNACTQDSLSGGQCVHTPVPVDDGNPCTVDSCDPVVGVKHEPALAGTPCSELDVCEGGSACDGAGACRPAAEIIDDGNPCTGDSCIPFVGITHLPLSAGADCSDATVCNGIELCDGGGTCLSGTIPVVDDQNPCTADACDPVAGVSHYPVIAGTSCSDGDACNGFETCTDSASCVGTPPPVVDDGNPCTADSCDPLTGVHHVLLAAGASCSDGNACNGGETCTSEGVCISGTAPQVDDGDRCTVDACDPVTGVTHQPIANCTGLPPNPADVAPPLDSTTPTSMQDATAFLYTGQDPIQPGVVSGTIDASRVAVIRGIVKDRAGAPVSGVRVGVLAQPELGWTLTREDGGFDLAVNGGGTVTLEYSKSGYLPAQRKVVAPWANFTWAPDVTLVAFDTVVTAVVPGSSAAQVARGSVVSDDAGTRRATVVFQPGTGASLRFKDGSTQSLGTFHVRATEYTVGATGPAAMPGELPASSGYTYAVELGVDEALASDASVEYTKPVPLYVENFLQLPVGSIVPVGYYDRAIGQWVASQDGRVVKILGVSRKLATIDANGDGIAEDATTLAALGFTDAERTQLATLYAVGTTLWRASVTHFSPFDLNFPVGCAGDCPLPNAPPPSPPWPDPEPDCQPGSIIDCQNQALGESVPLVGSTARLHYTSHRAAGRRVERRITIPLTGGTVPSELRRVELVVETAGQVFRQSFSPLPNQTYVYEWDGRDGYGRPVLGSAVATVRVGFTYQAVILSPSEAAGGRSFGVMSRDGAVMGVRPGSYFTRWSSWSIPLGLIDGRADGLYGWSLSPHHAYDPNRKLLYRGDGSMRFAEASETRWVITTVAGGDTGGASTGDGGPAVLARFYSPLGLVTAPDGSLLIADTYRVRKIDASGIITTIAGGGSLTGAAREGALATAVSLIARDIALGPDGALYILDTTQYDARVWKVGSDGRIRTFAGGGSTMPGDGLPATQAQLQQPLSIAVGPDGVVYLLEFYNLRRIGLDGIITTIAGGGSYTADDVPASRVSTATYGKISVGPDGGIYMRGNWRWYTTVKRIGPDGYIRHFAGTNERTGWAGDGGPATLALLGDRPSPSAGPDGSVFITDRVANGTGVLRLVTPDGIIRTIAGSGASIQNLGEGGPALQATIHPSIDTATVFGPDGAIYLTDSYRVRKLVRGPGLFSDAALAVPSEDGTEVYHFDVSGRHLRTIDSRTAVVLYTFAYDTAGRLVAMTDRDGGVTLVERDASGNARAIVAPFGQRTTISPDAYGYLADVTNPIAESWSFTSDAGGLLQTLRDPRGGQHVFTYDALGRLTSDSNPGGGVKTLTQGTGYSVSIQTALGRVSTYEREALAAGETRRVRTYPDGTQRIEVSTLAGTRTTTLPDGTTVSSTFGPDPRFSMAAPVVTSVTTTPSGLTREVAEGRSVTLSNPDDKMSVTSATNSLTVNGNASVRTYTASSRALVVRSPANRAVTLVLDDHGRPSTVQVPGRLPQTFTYYGNGRIASVTQGSRTFTFGHDAQGNLSATTDPLLRTSGFGYDGAGRLQSVSLPGGRSIAYTYDANGNVTTLTPPGRPGHAFTYAPTERIASYTPPFASSTGLLSTTYGYDVDGGLTQVLLPDESTIVPAYDAAGRLSSMTASAGTTWFAYDAAGRVASVTAPDGGTVSYGYDGSLPTSETSSGTVVGTLDWTYDNDFRVASLAVNGSVVSHGYDADGLLTRAGALTIAREAVTGRVSGTTLGSTTTTQSYDGYGSISTFNASAGASGVYSYSLTPDDAGRIVGKTETVQGITTTFAYGYDDAGRLAAVWQSGQEVASYTYDLNGNRLTRTTPAGTESASYDDQDRIYVSGSVSYAYRPNGALATKAVGTETTAYDYDAFGNLRDVVLPDGKVVSYVVDGLNRRVGKKVDDVLVEGFLYQGQLRPVAWLDGNGNVIARFVYGLRVNVPEYMTTDGHTYRIITDHLGSPRLVVDTASGVVVQRMDYDAFGNVLADSAPGFQPFGFAGGLYDRDTGLVRFGARDYDPQTGRWTNKDPIRFAGGTTNLYEYVGNDPVNFTDPEGLEAATAALGGGIALGGGAAVAVGAAVVGVGVLICLAVDDCRNTVSCLAQLAVDVLKCAGPTATAKQCPEDPNRCLKAAVAKYEMCRRTGGNFTVINGGGG